MTPSSRPSWLPFLSSVCSHVFKRDDPTNKCVVCGFVEPKDKLAEEGKTLIECCWKHFREAKFESIAMGCKLTGDSPAWQQGSPIIVHTEDENPKCDYCKPQPANECECPRVPNAKQGIWLGS